MVGQDTDNRIGTIQKYSNGIIDKQRTQNVEIILLIDGFIFHLMIIGGRKLKTMKGGLNSRLIWPSRYRVNFAYLRRMYVLSLIGYLPTLFFIILVKYYLL